MLKSFKTAPPLKRSHRNNSNKEALICSCHCERSEAIQNNSRLFGFAAFTLAEILISIAILGIVAALTIPALRTNVNARANQEAHNLFYSGAQNRMLEVLRQMNTEGDLMGNANTLRFVDKFANYMKIDKRCDGSISGGNGVALSECFAPTIYNSDGSEAKNADDIEDTTAFNEGGFAADMVALRLVNGYSMLIGYDSACSVDQYNNQTDPRSCVAFVYDINTNSLPNKEGTSNDISGNRTIKFTDHFPNCIVGGAADGMCYGNLLQPLFTSYLYYTAVPYPVTSTYQRSTTSNLSGPAGCTDNDGSGNNGPTWACPDLWASSKNYCSSLQGHLPTETEMVSILDDMVSKGTLTVTDTLRAFNIDKESSTTMSIPIRVLNGDLSGYPAIRTGFVTTLPKYSVYNTLCVKN